MDHKDALIIAQQYLIGSMEQEIDRQSAELEVYKKAIIICTNCGAYILVAVEPGKRCANCKHMLCRLCLGKCVNCETLFCEPCALTGDKGNTICRVCASELRWSPFRYIGKDV